MEGVEALAVTDRKMLEGLLRAPLVDWMALKKAADEAMAQTRPFCATPWIERPSSIKKKHLEKGGKSDFWQGGQFIVIKAHPCFHILILFEALVCIERSAQSTGSEDSGQNRDSLFHIRATRGVSCVLGRYGEDCVGLHFFRFLSCFSHPLPFCAI